MTLFVSQGAIRAIYDDELMPVIGLGQAQIKRASHVEPSPSGWTADMSPLGGPVLGPFPTRREALAAEREYIETRQCK